MTYIGPLGNDLAIKSSITLLIVGKCFLFKASVPQLSSKRAQPTVDITSTSMDTLAQWGLEELDYPLRRSTSQETTWHRSLITLLTFLGTREGRT